MIKKIAGVCFIIFASISCGFAQAQSEKLTITSYYPSPTGVYQTLRIAPGADPNDCATGQNEGKMYYDAALHVLRICSNSTAGVWGYSPAPGPNGYWGLAGSNLTAFNTAWNVGIGTTTPNHKLVVNGDILIDDNIDGYSMLRIDRLGAGFNSGVKFSTNLVDQFMVHLHNAGTLSINNGSRDILSVTSGMSGVVEANGNILIDDNYSGYSMLKVDRSDVGRNTGVKFSTNLVDQFMVHLDGNPGILSVSNGLGNVKYLAVTSGGNVGIGTIVPAYNLDIQSNSNTHAWISSTGADQRVGLLLGGNHMTANQWAIQVMGDVAGDPFVIRNTGGSERLTITTGGNVGIGTTSPTAKLDVVGTVKVSTAATAGKIVCVRPDGTLGTCTGGVSGLTGDCTCGGS